MASRRDFFTTLRNKNKNDDFKYVRPPYGLAESSFIEKCTIWEEKFCVASCEQKIIVIRSDGTPILNFSKKGCTFCEDCATACDSGVLSLEHIETSEVINARFIINPESCVAHNGVICFSCKEPCIDDAILFNGMFNPVIDMDLCTGCGYCFRRCPTMAIKYTPTILNKGAEV